MGFNVAVFKRIINITFSVLKTNPKKLKYQQRQLSKKTKESNSRLKQKSNLATVNEKATNIRKDYSHKVIT